jgi:hypothetical protein
MKSHPAIRKLACALFAGLVLGSGAALSAQDASSTVQAQQARTTRIANILQGLQQRFSVDNPSAWAARYQSRLAGLGDEQLKLAERATSLAELELLFIEAPVRSGTSLGAALANNPGSIAMMGSKGLEKSNPVSSPGSYAGLVFTAVQPCRIYDSRFSTAPLTGSPSTPWPANTTQIVDVGPEAGGYAFQGGQATNCAGSLVAGGQIAAAMTAVSTVNQGGAGYLVFFPDGGTNPNPYGVAQWFQPNYVQTSFVVMPTNLITTVYADGFIGNASSHVIVDLIGYFAAETNDGVTSITAGTGLTGGTITTTGTVAIATAYQLPQACTNGQVAQSNGTGGWACFTLTVNQAPAITSANATAFTVGNAGTFRVTATGFPAPTFSVTGALPSGVTFNPGTGVLSGTPGAGTGGTYPITITASNGVGSNGTQSFTLTVQFGIFGMQPSTMDFGQTPCGTTSALPAAQRTVTITNTGTAPFAFTAQLTSGASFYTLSVAGGTVNPGNTFNLTVVPNVIPTTSLTTNDLYAGQVAITTDIFGDTPHIIVLHETAYGARLTVNATILAFGSVTVGQSALLPFTLTNSGNATANIAYAGYTTPPFAAAPDLVPVLGNTTLNGTVTFAPQQSGAVTGQSLAITTSDVLCLALPTAIQLSGTGVP